MKIISIFIFIHFQATLYVPSKNVNTTLFPSKFQYIFQLSIGHCQCIIFYHIGEKNFTILYVILHALLAHFPLSMARIEKGSLSLAWTHILMRNWSCVSSKKLAKHCLLVYIQKIDTIIRGRGFSKISLPPILTCVTQDPTKRPHCLSHVHHADHTTIVYHMCSLDLGGLATRRGWFLKRQVSRTIE